MSNTLPVGPYRAVDMDDGSTAPWYIMPFDKRGNCVAPLTRDELLASTKADTYTDIFLFSHGWNNTWHDALQLYETFLVGYTSMVHDNHLSHQRPFRPLFVGVFWPSIALLTPPERSPAFATVSQTIGSQRAEREDEQLDREMEDIAADLERIAAQRFHELVQAKKSLDQEQALELANILSPCYARGDDELPYQSSPPNAPELVDLWRLIAANSLQRDMTGNFGYAVNDMPLQNPTSAALLLDPRWPIWALTVWRMKDRAGTVGSLGVSGLLGELLSISKTTRLHLVGHSYGCKVLLSALCYRELPRPVHSLLLLQPAVSYLCFARDALGTGQPGGYHSALTRVTLPIFSTFSRRDKPLSSFFHLAVRRRSDFAEQRIAGAPTSRYAALGGFGPGGCGPDGNCIAINKVGRHYHLAPDAPRIYGLDATEAISGHSAISNEYTWWALYCQVAREQKDTNDD